MFCLPSVVVGLGRWHVRVGVGGCGGRRARTTPVRSHTPVVRKG